MRAKEDEVANTLERVMDDPELEVKELLDCGGAREKRDREQIDTMKLLLSDARIRLDQYIGMCACPGMPCVTACRECDATQDLVNRIRAFMQGRTTR